jgi:hypothetical protein
MDSFTAKCAAAAVEILLEGITLPEGRTLAETGGGLKAPRNRMIIIGKEGT